MHTTSINIQKKRLNNKSLEISTPIFASYNNFVEQILYCFRCEITLPSRKELTHF